MDLNIFYVFKSIADITLINAQNVPLASGIIFKLYIFCPWLRISCFSKEPDFF